MNEPKLKVLDLFSGIGGFSLGLERTGGFETVAFCEIEPFCRRVLAKHWQGVHQFDDITTADFELVGPVDVVTAGFPCQDISLAGQGAGLSGERSGLFWHILRTVRMVGRPKLLLENVAALLDRGMGAVLGALATVGYDAEWHCISASAVGAHHVRDRVWIVADTQHDWIPIGRGDADAGALGGRSDRVQGDDTPRSIQEAREVYSNTYENGCKGVEFGRLDPQGWARPLAGQLGSLLASRGRWEAEPRVGRVADGVPNRAHRIAALGNAVVPQIPELIGNAILESRRAA